MSRESDQAEHMRKEEWDKARCEAAHFKARLQERYGITLNRHEYWKLCKQAASAHVFRAESIRRTIRYLNIQGQRVPCVFDGKRGRLITALLEEQVEAGTEVEDG
jgi:hypothetical protein